MRSKDDDEVPRSFRLLFGWTCAGDDLAHAAAPLGQHLGIAGTGVAGLSGAQSSRWAVGRPPCPVPRPAYAREPRPKTPAGALPLSGSPPPPETWARGKNSKAVRLDSGGLTSLRVLGTIQSSNKNAGDCRKAHGGRAVRFDLFALRPNRGEFTLHQG
jgi:hypothetical protein